MTTNFTNEMSPIIKNSLQAMVDLFLDFAMEKEVGSQIGNISEFIIDCCNLEVTEEEFELLEEKFIEEFREDDVLSELNEFGLTALMADAISQLHQNAEIPLLITMAMKKANPTV